MIFYQTDQAVIEWDEVNKIIISTHLGYISGDEYRSGANKIIELGELKKTRKIMSDLQQAKLISNSDQKWIAEDWLPRAVKAGLRYNAAILPRSILAQMSMNSIGRILPDNLLEVKFFSTREDALAWLLPL